MTEKVKKKNNQLKYMIGKKFDSVQKCAKVSGISRVTISKIISKETVPNSKTIFKLCDALDCNPSDIGL